jgi:hypothetical protein
LDWQTGGFALRYSKRILWATAPEKGCRALMNLEQLTDAGNLRPWPLVIIDV